jgi:dipeptidyl aminopeptidase/acylaminoacyl peptidase
MEKRFVSIILILVLLIFIIGCAEQIEEIQPTVEPEPIEKDIEHIPQAELEKLCAEESWPPDCNVIADPEGRTLCEKCRALTGIEVKEEKREVGIVKEEDITQITPPFEHATDPDWSPDGSQIIFWGKNANKNGLYLVNSDGTGLRFITPGSEPSWSPVDNRIMFPIKDILYLIDLDKIEEGKTELASWTTGQASWSPDGKRITYSVFDEFESSSIWIMNSDGSGKTKLTTDKEGFCRAPAFSYDGSKVAYLRGVTSYAGGPKPDKKSNEIWVMNSDGSDKHMIFAPGDSVQLIFQSAWGKNNKILFFRDWIAKRTPQIWAINSDGTNPKCVVSSPERYEAAFYGDPAWDRTATKVAVNKEARTGSQTIVTFTLEE